MQSSIREIKELGKLIILDDGSKWEVSLFDSSRTKMWMKSDLIEASSGNLKNLSRNNEAVSARKKI